MKRIIPFVSSKCERLFASSVAICLLAISAGATPPMIIPSSFDTNNPNSTNASANFIQGLRRSNYLLQDMWGLRPWLSKYGVSLNILETSEVLGNFTGGAKHGVAYDGLTQADLQLDTQRAFQLYGGTFNISALQVHGRNLSANYLDTLQTASGIEADQSTRLWELWYQQKFLVEDRLDVKIGQQSLDQEFMVSQNASLFVNTMFGWPMLPSADLPGGGPAYPLSAPGIRFRARPINELSVLLGVFNGSTVSNNTRKSGTGLEQVFRSIKALWSLANCNTLIPQLVRWSIQRIHNRWRASISSAFGMIPKVSPISKLTTPAFPWPIPKPLARRKCTGAIAPYMQSWIR